MLKRIFFLRPAIMLLIVSMAILSSGVVKAQKPIVTGEFDRFLVKVFQHLMGQTSESDLGVPHGSSRIAVHRAEIPLAVNQRITQGKVLSHAHDGIVNRSIAMGVVLTDHIPHNSS